MSDTARGMTWLRRSIFCAGNSRIGRSWLLHSRSGRRPRFTRLRIALGKWMGTSSNLRTATLRLPSGTGVINYLVTPFDYSAYWALRLWAPVFLPIDIDLLDTSRHVGEIPDGVPVLFL